MSKHWFIFDIRHSVWLMPKSQSYLFNYSHWNLGTRITVILVYVGPHSICGFTLLCEESSFLSSHSLFSYVLATDLLLSLTVLSTDIVDKTASFVARNGPEFEARIRQNEIGNPKFNFLNFGDPYHAYYQYKVKDFREGRGESRAYLH